MILRMSGRGAVRGQQTRRSTYEPGCGRDWRTSVCFPASTADKLHEILSRLEPRPSMAAALIVLIERMPTSLEDPPLDWAGFEADLKKLTKRGQEELPLVS